MRIIDLILKERRMLFSHVFLNPITLKRSEGNLEIRNIQNLKFFESDVNADGKNELYVLSYASCQGHLKIYKIEE